MVAESQQITVLVTSGLSGGLLMDMILNIDLSCQPTMIKIQKHLCCFISMGGVVTQVIVVKCVR